MSTHRAPRHPLRSAARIAAVLVDVVDREAFTLAWWAVMVALLVVAVVVGSVQ